MKKDIKKITFELIQIIKQFDVKVTKGKPEKKKVKLQKKKRKEKKTLALKIEKKNKAISGEPSKSNLI
jgi:hypothetical protein